MQEQDIQYTMDQLKILQIMRTLINRITSKNYTERRETIGISADKASWSVKKRSGHDERLEPVNHSDMRR